jgi:RNA polymerase sigma-70 factor, ECF subfamily
MPARAPRPPEPPELAVSMAAYQAGDLSAFDAVYDRLSPVLRRFLLSLTHDDGWTDDLVQETFLQIHRSRRTYNPACPVQPWALAIAHHVLLMGRRTRRRKHDCDPAAAAIDPEMLAVRGSDDALIARDRVQQAVSALTPGTRRAVVGHHVFGFSFAEIARALGIQEAAAKLRASRGMAVLRQTLSDDPRRRHR